MMLRLRLEKLYTSTTTHSTNAFNDSVSAAWNSTFQNSNENLAFSDQHWNSFVDITGDCSSDIIITNANSQIEFWIYTKNKFTLGTSIEL